MANEKVNKIVLEGGEVLIDLTADTVTAESLASGVTAHDKSGAIITGTSTKDVNSTDATATAVEVLSGRTFYARGSKITGTMPNKGQQTGTISTKAGSYNIPMGFHDGSGSVSIATTEQAKLIPTNIREGVVVLGVTGTMSSTEGERPETGKVVTPTFDSQTILPGSGYTCFHELTVNAIPVVRANNSAGGVTVTIG